MTLYDIGDQVEPVIYVTTDAGVASAATVAVTVTLPDGTTVTPTPTTPAVGTYTFSYAPAVAGTFYVNWTATSIGGVSGENDVYQDSFTVSASNNAYISVDEAKAFLNLQADTQDDELLSYVEFACDLSQQIADTQFARLTVVDTLSPRCMQRSLELSKRPVLSMTSVTENGSTLTTGTSYTTDLRWGRVFRQYGQYIDGYWWAGRRNVVATYVAGYQVIPPPVRFATLQIVEHLWSNQRTGSPLAGPAFFDDSPHSIRASQAGHAWNVPNKARDVLMDYRPPNVA